MNLSSKEHAQTVNFSSVWYQKLYSDRAAIPLLLFTFVSNVQRRILFNLFHF